MTNHPVPGEGGGKTLSASDAAALLAWWRLAGADTLVGETPRPWLEAAPAPTAKRTPVSPAKAAPAGPAAADWAQIDSLVGLRAAADVPPGLFSEGDPAAPLMLLFDAPSRQDRQQGCMLSGDEGQLLDRMLAAIDLERSRCYLAFLCPRHTGRPGPAAVEADLPLAVAHIRLAAPKFLLLFGDSVSRPLIGNDAAGNRGKGRGEWQELLHGLSGIRALPTRNPSYLLKYPAEKAVAWQDLLLVKDALGQ